MIAKTETMIKNRGASAHSIKQTLSQLVVNIIIPTFVLMKCSSATLLGPFYSLIVALSFPLLFGIILPDGIRQVLVLSINGSMSRS